MAIRFPVLLLLRWLISFCTSVALYLCPIPLLLHITLMLSDVFRFVLPELSSHFVLHDLLRSFCLERPLSSSRVPPWDLLSVLRFLRGSPFEPLTSCSQQDRTRKVLFLVSLATARRVCELRAVPSSVAFSGEDMYLSYLPEFRAKTESSANPLPRSFCVCSLRDFDGDLPNELLLCPVRALWVYLLHAASISPCPRSLLVSPRSPSCPLSKNALSFFFVRLFLRLLPLLPLLPRLRLHLLLFLLLLPQGLLVLLRPRSMLTVFAGSPLRLLLHVMLHFLLFLRPLPGLLPLFSLLSTLRTFSFL